MFGVNFMLSSIQQANSLDVNGFSRASVEGHMKVG